MATPIVLISGCSEFDVESLVKDIIASEVSPETVCSIDGAVSYPWAIDTKYYTADVQICVTKTKTIGDRDFAAAVQAIVLHFDPVQESSFSLVKSWLPFIKEIDPEVKLLVCEKCSDNTSSKNELLEWCVEYGFELVETDPERDDDEEDDFAEPRGTKRIVSALHAHTWPNLVLKDSSTSFRSPYMQLLMQQVNASGRLETVPEYCSGGAEAEGEEKGASEPKENKVKEDDDDLLSSEDMRLFEALGNEDTNAESFEALFERMRLMKDKAESLPEDERKAYAEKVAIQFWKAMEGDQAEIDGFSSDEET